LLRAEANALTHVETFLRRAHALALGDGTVEVHAPMPAPMALRAGRHRGQMLLSAVRRVALHTRLDTLLSAFVTLPEARRVRWSIDVDPVDLY
jgi:primosomal protein N' (replication factor Y)